MQTNSIKATRATLLRALPILSVLLLSGTAAYAQRELTPATSTKHVQRVHLGHAVDFVLLTEAGITDVPASVITGNVGTSPITGAADLLTCAEVTGKIFSVDAAGPAPCSIVDPHKLTVAVNDMQAAYTDAAGRAPATLNLGSGEIGGLILRPGVYNWTSGVDIGSDVKLKGGPRGVWIFQVNGDLNVVGGASVLLGRRVQTGNVFWQITGQATLGNSAHLEGVVLSKTAIVMGTNASVTGRLYAQTATTLQMNTITAPAKLK
jgi:hypothetical protein